LKKILHGISSTVLSERLLDLESEGLVTKKIYPEVPPKVSIASLAQASTRSGDNDDNDDKRAVLDVLLIGGVPLKEPVARYGPFVMNTQDEIFQAIEDYRSGRLGILSSTIDS